MIKRKYRGALKIIPLKEKFREAIKSNDHEKIAEIMKDSQEFKDFHREVAAKHEEMTGIERCPKCNRILGYGIDYIENPCSYCRKWSLNNYKSDSHGIYGRKKRYRIRTTLDFRKSQSLKDKKCNIDGKN